MTTEYSLRQAADRAGIPVERYLRMWSALGFANPDSVDTPVLSEDEMRMSDSFALLRQADGISSDAVLPALRSLGQAMARLAEWEWQLAAVADGEVKADLIDNLAVVHDVVWRRHMEDNRHRGLLHEAGSAVPMGIGFADMTGYTRLSRGLALPELTALLTYFEATTNAVIQREGGWVIKTVGDEVMFGTRTASAAAHIGIGLHEINRNPDQFAQYDWDVPQLRVGISFGEVVTRWGDVFGASVNLAARLTSGARPGTTLIDTGMERELSENEAFDVRQLRSFRARGYSSVHPFLLRAASSGT